HFDRVTGPAGIGVDRAVEIRIAEDAAEGAVKTEGRALTLVAFDILRPGIGGRKEQNIPSAVAAFPVGHIKVFNTDMMHGRNDTRAVADPREVRAMGNPEVNMEIGRKGDRERSRTGNRSDFHGLADRTRLCDRPQPALAPTLVITALAG